ncbi:AlpA family phage regulatory protein [Pelomonas sp. APW6]|uniref:AlpA family phage regulatory protein n=1 Tax=Roseateles subflavus TaxID=3053353 RepID=A0ABT7LKC3_9BURK|nr:AlpA family phage regulatory protein [Pelomonas sp. APW6]MDL5033322.1 AlpA family phage regulatory protein [Pelomonas sp. APW6]
MKTQATTFPTLVLRKRDVCDRLGISPAHLDRLRAAGQFITPIRLGVQAIGFLAADVDAWLASRPRVEQ